MKIWNKQATTKRKKTWHTSFVYDFDFQVYHSFTHSTINMMIIVKTFFFFSVLLRVDFCRLAEVFLGRCNLVQFSHSVMSDSATPWTAAHQASLSIINSWSLLKLMSLKSLMPSNHLILCHPLLLLPSIFPQNQGLFQWVSSSHQVTKVLELQLQHQSFQWIFRTDFL